MWLRPRIGNGVSGENFELIAITAKAPVPAVRESDSAPHANVVMCNQTKSSQGLFRFAAKR
jgi:hypothetical protein